MEEIYTQQEIRDIVDPTDLEKDLLLNFIELCFGDRIIYVATMQICNNTHALIIFISVDEPPELRV